MECENVLVALELSTFLNDANYTLQAVTQCYGLLAPIIYHNIVLVPVIQVRVFPSPAEVWAERQFSAYYGTQEQCIAHKVQVS